MLILIGTLRAGLPIIVARRGDSRQIPKMTLSPLRSAICGRAAQLQGATRLTRSTRTPETKIIRPLHAANVEHERPSQRRRDTCRANLAGDCVDSEGPRRDLWPSCRIRRTTRRCTPRWTRTQPITQRLAYPVAPRRQRLRSNLAAREVRRICASTRATQKGRHRVQRFGAHRAQQIPLAALADHLIRCAEPNRERPTTAATSPARHTPRKDRRSVSSPCLHPARLGQPANP